MKIRSALFIAMVCLGAGLAAIPAAGGEASSAPQMSYYFDCIDNEIDTASCKVTLVKSRSNNLRDYGIEAARRVQFLVKNKEALAQEMLARGVPLRTHAVHQYLLSRFNQEIPVPAADERP
jgi:hypothetical protein